MTDALLQVRDLTVRFGPVTAVDGIDLDVDEGEVLAVLGPSGSGKSTLLRAVAGLQPLDAGTVHLAGRPLDGVPPHRRQVGLMFQDHALFPHRDVAGNVGFGPRMARVPPAEAAERVRALLALVELEGYDRRPIHTLSGGEQQRVALARSLAADPALLLLDEPLSALDRSLRDRLAADLREILVATGTTALMVTHDHDEAFTVADRMAVMLAGRVAQEGPSSEVWRAPASREVAEFVGFGTFLSGAGLEAFLRATGEPGGPTGVLALRRSALRVDPEGELSGTVRRAVTVSDAVHLDVDVDGVGEVAATGEDPDHQPGDRVRLRVDRGATAYLT